MFLRELFNMAKTLQVCPRRLVFLCLGPHRIGAGDVNRCLSWSLSLLLILGAVIRLSMPRATRISFPVLLLVVVFLQLLSSSFSVVSFGPRLQPLPSAGLPSESRVLLRSPVPPIPVFVHASARPQLLSV